MQGLSVKSATPVFQVHACGVDAGLKYVYLLMNVYLVHPQCRRADVGYEQQRRQRFSRPLLIIAGPTEPKTLQAYLEDTAEFFEKHSFTGAACLILGGGGGGLILPLGPARSCLCSMCAYADGASHWRAITRLSTCSCAVEHPPQIAKPLCASPVPQARHST